MMKKTQATDESSIDLLLTWKPLDETTAKSNSNIDNTLDMFATSLSVRVALAAPSSRALR
jgi:hypothetical protein